MNTFALAHLDDQVLLRDLAGLVARDRTTTAALLAHLAEVEERKLYLSEAHPSLHSYCVHVLGLSEDAAFKRIRVARVAREFPPIFTAVAEGALNLSTVLVLAPHLFADTADDLLVAAARKSKAQVRQLLAQRFPRADVPTRIEVLSPSASAALFTEATAPGIQAQLAPERVEGPRPRVTPLAPERFSVEFTMGQAMHDKLRHAQALLSHQLPAGDVAEVFERALDALIVKLEKAKFAATDRPRTGRQRPSANPRHIPAHVKRAVRDRDGDQCTFVSDAGARCPARTLLEFDHIDEVARGGAATTERMRLRCRAHNQYEADRTFGTGFMQHKRDEARRAAAERRVAAERAGAKRAAALERATEDCSAAARIAIENTEAVNTEAANTEAANPAEELDLIPCLRQLGFRVEEARLAMRHCESVPDSTIEGRLRTALRFLGSKGRTYGLRQAASSSGAAAGIAAT